MNYLTVVEGIKQFVLPDDSLKNRDKVSPLALNTLGLLGNLAMQCKRVLPEGDTNVLSGIKCLTFISAANNFDRAGTGIEEAARIKDVCGERQNEVKLLRSAMQFSSGILYFSSLGLSLSSSMASFKAVITASKILSKTTSVLSNAAVFLMLLLTSMKVHEQRGFQQELNKKLNDLQADSNLSPQEKEKAIANFLKEQISLSEPLQEKLKTKLQERYNKKSIEVIKGSKKAYYQSIDAYVAQRFPKEVAKKELAKTAYIKRMTDRGCIELIHEINVKDPTAIDVTVKKVQEVAYKNILFNYLGIGLAVVGLLGLGVSFIPGAAFVTLSTILGLIPTVAFSVLGVYDLVQSLQSNKEGLYDRLVLLATGCVVIISSAALYALTENILVKCAAALLALIWLSLLYYVSSRLENQPKSA